MSHTLSQPEEIDCVLMEMAKNGMEMDTPIADKRFFNATPPQQDRSGRYITPYRAALMRSIYNLPNP